MKEITWTNLKKKNLDDILKGECLRVTNTDSQYIYIVINPQELMRYRIETNCDLIDKSRGF